jgi:hypothetical protein
MPSREPSCLIDDTLVAYRQAALRLHIYDGQAMDSLCDEIERLRAGIQDALSLVHIAGAAPATYDMALDILYEMASRIEGLLPPSVQELAEEADGLGRMER